MARRSPPTRPTPPEEEKRIKDDDTGVVYFEFRPDGSYRGLSYFFAPGNGYGFCTSEVVSTVKLSGGKLAGAKCCS